MHVLWYHLWHAQTHGLLGIPRQSMPVEKSAKKYDLVVKNGGKKVTSLKYSKTGVSEDESELSPYIWSWCFGAHEWTK